MKRRTSFGWSRRTFLQGLGLSAFAAPLLPILNASGQENLRPKRLILLFTPDGAPARDYNTTVDFRPTGTETNFAFRAIHAPLEPHKAKIVMPWGLRMTAGGAGENHAFGMAGLWTASTLNGPSPGADFDGGNGNRTGWGSGPSLDQVLAQAHGSSLPYGVAPSAANQETPYRNVELGVRCQGPTSLNRMIYAGENAPLHPEVLPSAAFSRLFAGIDASGSATGPDPAEVQRLLERNALIDYLKGDLARIRTKIGREEYGKLDAHLEALLSIQRRLGSAGPGVSAQNCRVPEAPSTSSFPEEIRAMMDIAVGALSCDVTRILSLQLSYGFSHVTHTWLGHSSDHHNMSHDGTDRRTELQQIDAWYAEQVAYFLAQLDAVPEGDGTLLDHTLVVWGRELGSTAHRMDRVPFVVAGGGRLGLRTGRFLDFDGQEHVRLLVSIGQLLGLETDTFGNRVANSGGLAGFA